MFGRSTRWAAAIAANAALLAAPAQAWRPLAPEVAGIAVFAVAWDPATRRVAAGVDQGLWSGGADARLEAVLRTGPVVDVAWREGVGWIAVTPTGLYAGDGIGSAAALSAGPQVASGAVRRIAVEGGFVAIAGESGGFVSDGGGTWLRLGGASPSGRATSVALRRRGDTLEWWVAVGGELWRAAVSGAGGHLRVAGVRRVRAPADAGDGAIDITLALPGLDVVVLHPALLHVRDRVDGPWRRIDLNLPPGARAVRLLHAQGSLWLATDRGLLRAERIDGPWRRAAPPAGSLAIHALAAGDGAVFAATERGLLVRAPEPARPRLAPRGEGPPEPSLPTVHRAAIAYLGLRPERLEALRRGAARRGWLPAVNVRLARQIEKNRGRDTDEAFLSGDVRHLVDSDRDRSREFEASLTLSWDLGDVAYHPELIDVSREAREVIELRDDILDEITQLHFERLRVLAELAALPPDAAGESLRLRLRADELAAGIDAWTGGWFLHHLRPPVP